MAARFTAALIGFIIVCSGASARAETLLAAATGPAPCEAVAAWKETLLSVTGPAIDDPKLESQQFAKLIAPAFADSIFAPAVGKSYKALTDADKQSIMTALRACKARVPYSRFLEGAFLTGPHAQGYSAIMLRDLLESQTDADVAAARNRLAAQTAAAKAAAYNRPKTVPFSITIAADRPVNSVRCVVTNFGWRIPYNDYIFDGEKIAPRPNDTDGYHSCNGRFTKQALFPGLSGIAEFNHGSMRLYAIGDLCADQSDLLFIHWEKQAFFPRYDEKFIMQGRLGSPFFDRIPYHYYVPSGTDGLINPQFDGGSLASNALSKRSLNPVELGIIAAKEIMEKQCTRMPKQARVRGAVYAASNSNAPREGMPPSTNARIDLETFYDGVFYPAHPEKRLVHKDASLAETYDRLAKARLAYLKTLAEWKAGEAERFARGVGYIGLIMYGIYSTSPCGDPDLKYLDPSCENY